MKKFHINEKGEVKTCSASIRDCPFPASSHYLNQEIAVKEAERILAKKNKTVPSLSKNSLQTEQQKSYHNDNRIDTPLEQTYSDENIEPSLLRRLKNYKTDKTITDHLDKILYNLHNSVKKDKALTALSNNPNISEQDLMRIVSLPAPENRFVLMNTRNKKLVEMALANKSYVDTRHNALRNPLATTEDLHNITLLYPDNYYKKQWVSKLNGSKYSTDHIKNQRQQKTPENLKEANALKKMALVSLERRNKLENVEDIKDLAEKMVNLPAFQKLAYVHSNNADSIFKDKEKAQKFVELALRTKFYNDKLDKTREIVITKRRTAKRGPVNNTPRLPKHYYDPKQDSSSPEAKPAANPSEVDLMKIDKFKNTVSMASYEDAVELQERWKKGIDELPLDMRKNVLEKRYNNTQEGLRGIVDLFKTSDTEGQMVKSGLNNFANHVNHMREQEKKKGYIAVDNPEFITPAGMVKVEEHVGNFDYGEKMVFRVNGEKFEMSKPMQSDRWSTFIHVTNNSTEIEKPEVKKGFWARLLNID